MASYAQNVPVMAGGPGTASYDENSSRQGDAFSQLGGPILKDALNHWLRLRSALANENQQTVCIADLGSATGRNAVAQMELILECIASGGVKRPQEEGIKSLLGGAKFPPGNREGALEGLQEERGWREGQAVSVGVKSIGEVPEIAVEQSEPSKKGNTHIPSCADSSPFMSAQGLEKETHAQDSWIDPRRVLAFFSDLPGNDWATLMGHIHTASKGSPGGGIPRLPCQVAAVPGSFYERLFPDSFLDIATTSFSLQWLSRLPPEAQEPGWNLGRIWCYRDAPPHVVEAYRRQREADLRAFLKHRAAELRPGALLWLFMPSWDDSKDGCRSDTLVNVLEDAWRELTEEGGLESHFIDGFNVQAYFPTVPGVREAVDENGAFEIHALQYVRSRSGLEAPSVSGEPDARRSSAPTANQVWAAFQPQVSAHMGTEQANLVYDRICQNLARDPDRYPRGMTVLCAALFKK